jgi:hypothetical protein
MKRVVVYEVEQKKPDVATRRDADIRQSNNKKDSWTVEKRRRAMKTIENASTLSDIVRSIESLKLTDPTRDGIVIKEAVEKISTIVEEMKQEFKKDYWE